MNSTWVCSRASGHALFLVTGRRFETITLGQLRKLFTGIVWENGAVLEHTGTGEIYLPFGQLNKRLLKALDEHQILLERGLAIAATSAPHAQAVWQVLTIQSIPSGSSPLVTTPAFEIFPLRRSRTWSQGVGQVATSHPAMRGNQSQHSCKA